MNETVPLKEHLEGQIAELEKRTKLQLDAIEKALQLQAGKNEIHFNSLNGEQARLLEDRERFLPRETYAADRKDKMAFVLSAISILAGVLLFVIGQVLNS